MSIYIVRGDEYRLQTQMAYASKRTARIIEQGVVLDKARGMKSREVAAKYNLSQATIGNICKRNAEQYAMACREVANISQALSKKALVELANRDLTEVDTIKLPDMARELAYTSQMAAGKESQHIAINVNLDIPTSLEELKNFVLNKPPSTIIEAPQVQDATIKEDNK